MSNMNPENTVAKLDALVSEWATLFNGNAPCDVHFHITSGELLAVNDIPLCPVSEIDVDAATFDVEYLHIPTVSGSYYEIYIHCPFEGPSKIGYVHLISTVYCADSL